MGIGNGWNGRSLGARKGASPGLLYGAVAAQFALARNWEKVIGGTV